MMLRKYAHLGWHMAIKRTGFVKPGKKTFYPWGQQAIKFLHRAPYADPHPLKQLQNKHWFRLVIEQDGNVKGFAYIMYIHKIFCVCSDFRCERRI